MREVGDAVLEPACGGLLPVALGQQGVVHGADREDDGPRLEPGDVVAEQGVEALAPDGQGGDQLIVCASGEPTATAMTMA